MSKLKVGTACRIVGEKGGKDVENSKWGEPCEVVRVRPACRYSERSGRPPKGITVIVVFHPGTPQQWQQERELGTVAPVVDLWPAILQEMDAAVSAREKAANAAAKAWETRRAEQTDAEHRAKAVTDAAWAQAKIVVENYHFYPDDATASAEVAVYGPEEPFVRKELGNRPGLREMHRDRTDIDVAVRRVSFEINGPLQAEVNWPAIGSVSPAQARAFATALLFAADEAERMLRIVQGQELPA